MSRTRASFFLFGSVLGTLQDTLWGVFSCLWGVIAFTTKGFPKPGSLDSQKWRLTLSKATAPKTFQRNVFSPRAPKSVIYLACPWLRSLKPFRRRPVIWRQPWTSNLTNARAQTQTLPVSHQPQPAGRSRQTENERKT